MVERYRANIENPELGWETEVIFDDVVKREVEYHKELNSRRKKLIFVQETFRYWNPVEVGNLLRVDERTIKRFLSRRGIRNDEYQKIQKQFEGVFAVTSIIERQFSGDLKRIRAFSYFPEDMSLKEMLKQGMPEEAVFVAEKYFRYDRDEG